jgi:hypothetical protein
MWFCRCVLQRRGVVFAGVWLEVRLAPDVYRRDLPINDFFFLSHQQDDTATPPSSTVVLDCSPASVCGSYSTETSGCGKKNETREHIHNNKPCGGE